MAADFVSVRGWRNKLRALFAPPAWAADYHARRASGARAGVAPLGDSMSVEENHTAAFQTPRRP
jgi:hypothetical protein